MDSETIWVIVGFTGQAFFSARFLVQWVVSEAQRKSVIPIAFWFLSLGGGATLLTYAIWRKDPVIIAGQAGGLLIYLRNLYLIYRERGRAQTQYPADAA